ncbi:hypothetical protein B0H13DRAFT_1869581 [Mycena leptocephala]|nr:hypothetical protein B0H13DRAFT_1869581 [Mycena leptocephala]
MSAAPDPAAPVLQHHPIFYLEDGSLILRTVTASDLLSHPLILILARPHQENVFELARLAPGLPAAPACQNVSWEHISIAGARIDSVAINAPEYPSPKTHEESPPLPLAPTCLAPSPTNDSSSPPRWVHRASRGIDGGDLYLLSPYASAAAGPLRVSDSVSSIEGRTDDYGLGGLIPSPDKFSGTVLKAVCQNPDKWGSAEFTKLLTRGQPFGLGLGFSGFGQAWFDGKKSLRTWMNPDVAFPFWGLSWWGEVLDAAEAKEQWQRAASWLEARGKTEEELVHKSAVQGLWRLIGWHGSVRGFAGVPVSDLASYLTDYLGTSLVDAMLDLLSTRLKAFGGARSDSTIIANTTFAQFIDLAHPGVQTYKSSGTYTKHKTGVVKPLTDRQVWSQQ